MRYADLICIGSQKAGTTWLHRMLSGHPDVFAPALKEIHYFDTLYVPKQATFQRRRTRRSQRLLRERVDASALRKAGAFLLTEILRHDEARRYVQELRCAAALPTETPDDAWYAGFFADAPRQHLACDFTAAYAMLPPEGIAHLRRLSPRARVLYLVRDPVERALSHARMLVVRNGAPRNPETLRRYVNTWVVRSRDDSIATIDRWRAHWPAEQFHVAFYDDIAARPLQLLEEVCSFAGLPFDPRFFPRHRKVIYPGPKIAAGEELAAELSARFSPLLAELRRRYPDRTTHWAGRPRCRARAAKVGFSLPGLALDGTCGRRLAPAAFALACSLLGAIGAGGAYVGLLQATGNMHVVVPAELYRSAQPTAEQIAEYRGRFGIRTIVNLRGEQAGEDWYESELAESRALGISHVDFRMAAEGNLDAAGAADLVALLERAEKPVLIHCDDGAGRTGLAAALYLGAVKKLGEDAAESQLSFRFGNLPLPLTPAFSIDQSFEALEPWLGYTDS